MLNKKFFNFRPFLFIAVCIALGIGAGYAFYFDKALLGALLCLICLAFIAFTILFTGGEIKAKLLFGVVFVLIFSFGLGAFYYQVSEYDNANLEGHYYLVSGKVTSAVETEYGQRITLENVKIKGDRTGELRYGVSLLAYDQKVGEDKTLFDIGDCLEFESYLKDTGAIYEDKLSATNIERGIKYTATVQIEDITKTQTDLTIFEKIHIFFRDTIKSQMGERESAVAYGLLLGNTADMQDGDISSYRSAGVAHIFAVSGLHIGFLATALNWAFNFLKVKRLTKAIMITLALFFYSGICGFSASSLRASVMSAVLLFSAVRGNRYDGLSSVGIACALILACSPVNMFCVGFQLSFVVVLGMLILSPPLTRLMSFMPKKLANSLGAVISAQVVGIPICLHAFGYFSTIAILANLVFIPIVGAVFILLFLSVLIGGILGIANITLFIPNYIFYGINAVITAIDYEIFLVGGFVFGIFAALYYFALVLPSGLINLNKISKCVASIICAIVCAVGATVISIKEISTPKVYVIGDEKICATVIENQNEIVMVVSEAQNNFSLNRFNRLYQGQGIAKIDALIFTQAECDMQLVVTKLNQVFELNNIYYYGLTNSINEEVLRKSFKVGVRSFTAGEDFPILTNCRYALEGYAVEANINGYDIAVLSKFGDEYVGYKGLNGEYEYMVATDYEEFIYEEYKPKELISYKDNLKFKNALSNGTITIKLK